MLMHNPAHPGEILREYLGGCSVTNVALHLKVSRVALSRILSGKAAVSAEMAFRLSAAFGTTPEYWANMQLQYDLAKTRKTKKLQHEIAGIKALETA